MSRKMLVHTALVLPLLGLAAPAFAWKHIDPSPYAWKAEDLPVRFSVAPEEFCEETVPSDYCVTVMQQAHEAWEIGAPCAELGGGEYIGDAPGGNMGFTMGDGHNTVGFNDPDDGTSNGLEPGVLAANKTYRLPTGSFLLNGTSYKYAGDSDVVFNNDVSFATHEEIAGGQCQNRTNMRSVATHEVGHLYGMGHSCDEFDPCTDRDLKDAVMFWTSPNCEELITLQKDDIEGINTLYGPSASFTCSHELPESEGTLAIGNVPFTMKCVVEAGGFLEEIKSVEWNFGNGNILEGLNVENQYTEAGNYTVEVTVTGERETCVSAENPGGEWQSNYRKVGFVRACAEPDVAFTAEHLDGLTWTTINESDVSVYGCIQDIEWNVYKGEAVSGEPIAELTKKAWEPQITFPEEGTYTLVMNVGGPAGTSAAKLTIDVKDKRGEGRGCSHTGGGTGAVGLVLLAIGLVGRRRLG